MPQGGGGQRPPQVGPLEGDAELEQEKFVVGEPAAPAGDLVFAPGRVHHAVGVGQRRHVALAAVFVGQMVVDQLERGLQDCFDARLDRPAVDPLRRGVDRAQTRVARLGLARFGVEDLELGVGDLQPRAALLGGALHAEARARADLFLEEGHVEPDQVEPARVVAQHRLEPALAPHAADARRGDLAPGADDPARLQIGDARLGLLELVPHGQVGNEQAHVGHAQQPECVGVAFGDAGDIAEGCGQNDRHALIMAGGCPSADPFSRTREPGV